MGDHPLNHCEGVDHRKCCVSARLSDELAFGNLYTITKNDNKEERTYDEPYAGDLPRRSWLCCPGSQDRLDGEQPPLLEAVKTSPGSGAEEAVTWPPARSVCSGACVR